MIQHIDPETAAAYAQKFAASESVGQQRQTALHGGDRSKLVIAPNLWAGVGLVRGGAGATLVGSPENVAARLKEYAEIGIDTFVMSGYPHLEEAYHLAELVFPLLPLDRPAPPRDSLLVSGLTHMTDGLPPLASVQKGVPLAAHSL